MGATTTTIEWTDATWNPVRGCSVISPGCVNCYAMKQAHRFSGPGRAYAGLTKLTTAGPQWTGVVRTVDDALLKPLSWRRPRRVFVNSMSDLFHEDVPEAFIALVFSVMASTDHTYQVLTKRAERMRDVVSRLRWRSGFGFVEYGGRRSLMARLAYFDTCDPWEALEGGGRSSAPMAGFVPQNVWLGVSVEDQPRADARIPLLLQTPAAVRFISAEPLLGPIELANLRDGTFDAMTGGDRERLDEWDDPPRLDWVIVGGESGPAARPCAEEWIAAIVAQCRGARVPVFVKQLGAYVVSEQRTAPVETLSEAVRPHLAPNGNVWAWRAGLADRKGGDPAEWPAALRVREFPLVQSRRELVHG